MLMIFDWQAEAERLEAIIADLYENGVPMSKRTKPCPVCKEGFGPIPYFSGGRWNTNVTLWKKQGTCSHKCARILKWGAK